MSALKQILANKSLAYYYAQKGVRILPLRRALGACVARLMKLGGGKLAPPESGTVAQRLSQELENTGFAALPEKVLSAGKLEEIHCQLKTCPLYDYYGSDKTYKLAAVPADVIKVRYGHADVLACRGLMDLANDPDILQAVAQRLGATPILATVDAWWTLGEHNRAANKAFDDIYHRDADDLRFVKLFVYLTDTSLTSGAHRFVLGSHADDRFVRRGPIRDEDVESAYPAAAMLTVTGSAGTGFLEETWGIHRAMLATEGRRLIFSAIYTLAAQTPFAPAKPLLPLPSGYNRYVNRRLFY
ncbi:MAG: phytanoyl-CoA dioxygenase family protein [Polaromonas sp.]|uniref:phytanoyl-CoA dioxygenase family protein n=1 Tax=Polaromonas sp. TaxID=1869339 RepID=UPI003263299F